MKVLLSSLVALGALALALVYALGPPRVSILRPRLGIPAVCLAGEGFELELASARPWEHPEVEARLVGFEAEFALELAGDERTLGVRSSTAWLPEDAPVGSYDLVVRAGELEVRRERAVWVRASFPEDVRIAQLADLPTFGHDESGDRAFEQIVRELNLIDPDLVLLTGDIAYGGSVDQYARLYNHVLELEMPVVSALGNHEYEGLASYLETFGAPYHAVGFGALWIVSLNSAHGRDQLTESQMKFLRSALFERGDRTAVIQLHHPLFGERRVMARVGEFRELVAKHEVPIVLSGHLHRDMVFDAEGDARWWMGELEPPVYVVTTAAGAELRPLRDDRPSYHGYRLIELSKGALVRYSHDLDGDGAPDGLNSVPAGQLAVERVNATEVRVTNGWKEALLDARVRFELEGDRRALSPDVGTIAQVDFDGKRTRIAVALDLQAGETVTVRLGGSE